MADKSVLNRTRARRWRFYLLMICVPIAILVLGKAKQNLPMEILEHDGIKWEYSLIAPKVKLKGLIIAMHGAGGNGPQFAENSRIIKAANERGYAVLVPTGQPAQAGKPANFRTNPNLWNSGQIPPTSPRTKIDDLGFFEALVKRAEAKLGKTPLFITGHSNGSGMTYQLAMNWKSRVRAIASVSGQVPYKLAEKADQPIPSLFICGSEDPISPWNGGESNSPWGKKDSRSVLTMLKLWARWQGIESDFVESGPSDNERAFEARGEDPRQIVRVVRLEGHGHAWPGGTRGFADRMMGPNVATFDATKAILDWFDKYL
jgi:polyhydroxybutyrate depolymerase